MKERGKEIAAIGEDLGAVVLTDLPAIAASIVPWAGPAAASLIQANTNHKVRKQVRFLRDVSENTGRRVERLEAALADDKLGELVAHGLDVAAEIRDDEQFALLAAVVAEGLNDPETDHVDRAHVLIDVLRQLQPDHVRLLRDLLLFLKQDPSLVRTWTTEDGIRHKTVALPRDYAGAYQPLCSRLRSLGLIEEASPAGGYYLTPFGHELLGHIRNFGQAPS